MSDDAFSTIMWSALLGGIGASIGALISLLLILPPLPQLATTKCAACGHNLSKIAGKAPCPECGRDRGSRRLFQRPRLLPSAMRCMQASAWVVVIAAVIAWVMVMTACGSTAPVGMWTFPVLAAAFLPPAFVATCAATRLRSVE